MGQEIKEKGGWSVRDGITLAVCIILQFSVLFEPMPGPFFKSLFISHIVNAGLYHMYRVVGCSVCFCVSMNKALFFSCLYGGYGCNNTV